MIAVFTGAIFTPLSPSVPEMKLYWSPTSSFPSQPQTQTQTQTQTQQPLGSSGQVRIGRGPAPKYNDLMLGGKRISNRHCRIWRLDDWSDVGGQGAEGLSGIGLGNGNGMHGTTNPNEPIVIIEDLGSSNGTWVNSHRIRSKKVLAHGDEISLGSLGPIPSMSHDVRWIYKSVGRQGVGDEERVGEIFERFVFQETLGSGAFAEVKKAVEIATGRMVAIKVRTRSSCRGAGPETRC
jgi:serine/threonine/tyrosine protein kinase RAD53